MCCALALITCSRALSQSNTKKLTVSDADRVTVLTYGSPSWNLDSSKIDEAYIILRDKNSGRIVQIRLEETEPDSSQFSGIFNVNLGERLAPEIYVPPQSLRNQESKDKQKQLYVMIQSGKLSRKPMIWKRNVHGQAVMDVYDTRDQAEAALKAYDLEQAAARSLKRKKPGKELSKEKALEAAKDIERKSQLDKLALEAAQRATERVRLEQLEKQRAEQRELQMKALSSKQKAERRANAAQVAKEASRLYDAGNFKGAESKFKLAIELDPGNRDYYYKYGVTLYRNEKFNEALVALKLAKVPKSMELERDYFMGLVHYRLSELDNAAAKFNRVSKSSDPNLGPSAMFYSGVVYFAQEKFEPSKKAFETVIDTSQDPKMDAQAEEYIDRIAAAQAFKKLRENKFTFTGVVGMMYDSNVLLSPDNATGSATAQSDYRLVTIADLQYRPIYTEKNEFSPHFMVNLTNSKETESAKADPFIYTLTAPFSRSGKLGSKSTKFTLTPGYELLYMDPYGTGTKGKEQASYYATLDSMFIMSKTWISMYTLDYRRDNSSDVSSVGDEDMDSTKITLRTTQMLVLDKKRSVIPMLAYIKNAAVGKHKDYNRIDVGLTYTAPLWWETTGSAGLTVYQMKYPETTIPRTDKNYSLTLGATKPVKDWLSWGLTGTYTKNQSNITANEYTKYMVMTTLTFVTNF
jgi:tetratricopeptide (TPR) repeat protein